MLIELRGCNRVQIVPQVCILMSTYNGDKYLRTQLESLIEQEEIQFIILCRDDGSTDDTIEILEEYSNKINLKWYTGNNVGPAMSFMDLIQNAPDCDYYAFCDQDDYWESNKLKAAIKYFDNKLQPSLYFSDIKPVDENLNPIQYKKINPVVSLEAECIMNYAFGCTMVFNCALMKLLKKNIPNYVPMHDWWVYLVCLATKGTVIYDKSSYILYRQHSGNASGFKEPLKKQIKRRIQKVIIQKENKRSKMVKALLQIYKNETIKAGTYQILSELADYERGLRQKISIIKNKRLKCGMKHSDFTFRISILINVY